MLNVINNIIMAKLVEMDQNVTIKAQIQEKEKGSVILINKLNIEPDQVEQFLKYWILYELIHLNHVCAMVTFPPCYIYPNYGLHTKMGPRRSLSGSCR